MVTGPDGSEAPAGLKPGRGNIYELRHETMLSGLHHAHITLHGTPIVGSPVAFQVDSAAPVPLNSRLVAPEHPEQLVADLDVPSSVMLHTHDKVQAQSA